MSHNLVGCIIETSYGTGPYEVLKQKGPCTCPHPIDIINMDNPPNLPPHYHYTLKGEDGKIYHVNYYDENNQCVAHHAATRYPCEHKDSLIILHTKKQYQEGEQISLF